jgi:hypothetical protein
LREEVAAVVVGAGELFRWRERQDTAGRVHLGAAERAGVEDVALEEEHVGREERAELLADAAQELSGGGGGGRGKGAHRHAGRRRASRT